MKLQDDKPDSVSIYSDWLEDNDQLELANEIRNCEITYDCSHYEERNLIIGGYINTGSFSCWSVSGVGSASFLSDQVGESYFGNGLWVKNSVGTNFGDKKAI